MMKNLHGTKRPRSSGRSKLVRIIVTLPIATFLWMWICVDVCVCQTARDSPQFHQREEGNEEEDALADPEFRLFARSLYHSEQEPFRSYPCLPKHLHLAQASNVDPSTGTLSMTVSFTLDYNDCHWRTLRPFVRYSEYNNLEQDKSHVHSNRVSPRRLTGDEMDHIVVSVHPPLQFNYSSDKTHGETFQSDWIYHLELPNVRAGNILYWYRIAVPAVYDQIVEGMSPQRHRSVRGSDGYYLGETPTYTFRSPPLPGAPTSLAIVGDIGQTKDSLRTMIDIYETASIVNGYDNHHSDADTDGKNNNHDNEEVVTQLLIVGDLSYADAEPARWTSWMALTEPLVRSLSLHVAAGNHEVECTKDDYQIFIPYEHYFRVPNRLGEAITERISEQERRHFTWGCDAPSDFLAVYNYGNSFYSYDHGLVHVVVLNSYTQSTPGSPQYEWLIDELQIRFDRAVTPWLLVAFHCPWYTMFDGHVNERQTVLMRQHLEPIFVKFGVNFVVSGHDHAYLRTTPLAYDFAVNSTTPAPIYLILGAGGNREGHARGYRNNYHPNWEAISSNQDFGFAHWFIPNATHARYRWINNNKSESAFSDQLWMKNLYI